MAELRVRTHKAEYAGGETIYGAVYLKISGPTSAYGVWLKCFGYETFSYHVENSGEDNCLQDTKEYISSESIVLYEFEEQISLGQYVFPFQKKLPLELPGTTKTQSKPGKSPEFSVEIVYRIEAMLMGAPSVKGEQSIVILQPALVTLQSLNEINKSQGVGYTLTKSVGLSTEIPFIKNEVIFTACLDKEQYYAGDNMRLRLDIESSSSYFKPKISSITFEVLQDLKIIFSQEQNKDNDIASISSRILSWLLPPCSQDEARKNSLGSNCVQVESVHTLEHPLALWHRRLIDLDHNKLSKGIEELLIPLREDNNCAYPSTTLGHHVWLMYSIKIEICILRNDPVVLHLPLCCVWKKNTEWLRWKSDDWLYDCQVMTSTKSPCQVSKQILESMEFSSLPTFQVM